MTADSTTLPTTPAEGWLLALPLLPTPATLQGADFRIVEANAAFAAIFELPTDAMAGRDPVTLEPQEAQPGSLAERDELAQADVAPPLLQRRLIDSLGVSAGSAAR